MRTNLFTSDAQQFIENREEVAVATIPYEDGELVESEHSDFGHSKFDGETATEYLNQLGQESEEVASHNQFVEGRLVNPQSVDITGTLELTVHNSDGDLSYGLEFDVENEEDEYAVVMHGLEEEYTEDELEGEFQSYVENNSPKLRQALEEEFMDELM